jgi:ATP-binding cassette subfamily C protein CydD
MRFIEPSAGRILVEGRPLAETSPEAWRRRVAWVPQRPRLFHATLRENLLLARPGATRDEIEDALERAALGGLVRELPLGLETPLGEAGERLSGGEAQRVALARAFLKDAPVLVLDEPTAQLDLDTEGKLIDSVRALRRGRTVLLVAHRLTTLAAADRVAILSGGRIVEAGAPSALAAAGGAYARLIAAWGSGA